DALDALARDDAAHGERLPHAPAPAGDDDAVEDLHALLGTLKDAHVDVDGVADLELGHVFFGRGLLNQGQQAVLHGSHLPSVRVARSAGPPVGCGPGAARRASGAPPGGRRWVAPGAPPSPGRPGAGGTADTAAGRGRG